jgi:hypothetical protein
MTKRFTDPRDAQNRADAHRYRLAIAEYLIALFYHQEATHGPDEQCADCPPDPRESERKP